MNLNFRNLFASEIECKAEAIDGYVSISLHNTAAVCTLILNETVGPMNWQKSYTMNNKNCIVGIWDENKKEWVNKEDCGGLQTDIDGLKGQASNGFKRACALGWGLGLELYSQPTILIPAENIITKLNGKDVAYETYRVSKIEYEDKLIKSLTIVDSNGNVVYENPNVIDYKNNVPGLRETVSNKTKVLAVERVENKVFYEEVNKKESNSQLIDDDNDVPEFTSEVNYVDEIRKELKRTHINEKSMLKAYKVESLEEMSDEALDECLRVLQNKPTYEKATV